MIDGVLVSGDAPVQDAARDRCADSHAIVNAGFNFGGFFIVVPSDQLEKCELIGGGPHAVRFVEAAKPGLPALLLHQAVGAPARQGVVESLVRRADRQLRGILLRS